MQPFLLHSLVMLVAAVMASRLLLLHLGQQMIDREDEDLAPQV